MNISRREFITQSASATALAIFSPLQTIASPSPADLGKKAGRGNMELIRNRGISVKREIIEVRGEKIIIMVFEKIGPSRQKFFVPHDNEVAAFDTALRFVGEHGGALITFDSAGGRNLKTESGRPTSQDPNRMFIETSSYWPLAKHMLELVQEKGKPVITLHNNAPIGSFIASLNSPTSHGLTLSIVNKETKRDIVLTSGRERTPTLEVQRIITALNVQEANCVYEYVDETKPTNGTLSQYCTLKGIPYFNIETGLQGPNEDHVVNARERQMVILRALTEVLGEKE